jgi:hypothetical protein
MRNLTVSFLRLLRLQEKGFEVETIRISEDLRGNRNAAWP